MKIRWRTAVRRLFPDYRIVPIFIAAILAVLVILSLLVLSRLYSGQPGEIFRGIYIEATGAAMDIIVFGIVLALLMYWADRHRERTLDIARQKETD